jgi:ElaB/YqjD/DUF883 family membrane-anchored ribosome-binding protein
MSEPLEGTGAAAVGAHSKDAMTDPQNPTPPHQGRSESASGGSGETDGLGASIRGASDAAKSAAERAGQEASRLATSAGEGISRSGRQAYRRGAQAGSYVGETVRSDPLISLAVVGALGFALGLLIGRR